MSLGPEVEINGFRLGLFRTGPTSGQIRSELLFIKYILFGPFSGLSVISKSKLVL